MTQRIDLYHLAGQTDPTRDEIYNFGPLTLVYEPADGSGPLQYEVDLLAAWSYDGSPYELLSGRFEDYDGDGSCYFIRES